jgi:spoIIIJ-associated protein
MGSSCKGDLNKRRIMTEEGMDQAEELETVETVEEIIDESQNEDNASTGALTDEELDLVADTAIAALKDILKYFNVGQVTIDEYEGDDGELILDITGDDLAVLIGRHGRTLESLQFLISVITSRTIGFRYPIVVDVEGYKSRQRQKLEDIAESAAHRAISQDKEIRLRPMTPYERRIIHITLRDNPDVETHSEGEGRGRRVVITPQ